MSHTIARIIQGYRVARHALADLAATSNDALHAAAHRLPGTVRRFSRLARQPLGRAMLVAVVLTMLLSGLVTGATLGARAASAQHKVALTGCSSQTTAVGYAECAVNWNKFDNSSGLYCAINYTSDYQHCLDANGNRVTDTYGQTPPGPGYFQPNFQCNEFVARALAAEGLIPNLTQDSPQQNYGAYIYPATGYTYDLLYTGDSSTRGLYDLLKDMGAANIHDDPQNATPGDVVFYYKNGALEHSALLITSGANATIDSHNRNYQHSGYSASTQGFTSLDIIHIPPFNSSAVTLFTVKNYSYNASSPSLVLNPGFYDLATYSEGAFYKRDASLLIPPSWNVTVYLNSNQIGGEKTFYASDPDLSRDTYGDNATYLVYDTVSAIAVSNTSVCSIAGKHKSSSAAASCPPPSDCVDGVTFITDVTLPDNTAVTPGQALNKTWRIQNSGTCTWSNYSLIFTSGVQMSAPSSVAVDTGGSTTAPGQTVDITVPMTAPNDGGTYRGDWQLVNSQGVYVSGGEMWIIISVPYSGGGGGGGSGGDITVLSNPLLVVTPGQHFQPQIQIQLNNGQLLQSRGDMLRNSDGNLYSAWPFVAVVGTVNAGSDYTFTFYSANPMIAPSAEGTYQSIWQVWENGTWVGSPITITFTVKNGGGTRPNTPTPTQPGNWAEERDGSTPQLCATTSSSNVQYDFQIYQSAQTPDSGWINGNCWTPSPALGPYTFEWHVKVRDNASGLESDWSESWNFTVDSQQLTMDPITFSPPSPSSSIGVQVRSCVQGFGNVNLGLTYSVNTANDGSANGTWRGFSNAGNNCPDPNNPSTWGGWPTLDYTDGDHLVRAVGTGPQGQTMTVYAVYHLNHRPPQGPQLLSPINNVRINTNVVTFAWAPAVNAYSYELIISPNADFSGALFDQNVGTATSHTYTFSPDLSPVYWKVNAINDLGQNSGSSSFGIDRVAPTAAVGALPGTTVDSQFTVTWSGADNDAGVQWYNIQYRDGNASGAPWTDWQTNTTITAALFTGQPGHTYYFRAQAMDKATNLSAYAGGDGDTHTLIDLNARPVTKWWDPAYASKRDAIILNNDPSSLPTGYPIHLHFDASTTPSASDLYNGSLSATKGDDVRIVYQDTTELPRYLATFTASDVDIWFNLQAPIGGNPATDSTNYQIYYGNANASHAPGTINDVIPEGTDANTLGLWHLQEGSGTSISDSSGNGINGTASNMGWTTGKFGPAGVFSNNAHAVVDLGPSTSFDTPYNITLEAWVNPTDVGGEQSILRKQADDGSLIFDFQVQGQVWLRLNGNEGNAHGNTTLQPGHWYHIAGTYDGSTIRVYLNGVLDGSASYSKPLRYGTSTHLYLGGDGQNNNKYFDGLIQDARISNTVRSSFPYASFATILSEPSTGAGSPIPPPQTGTPSLAIQGVTIYGGTGGSNTIVVGVQNQGTLGTANGFTTALYLNHQPTGPGDLTGAVNTWVASPIGSSASITLAGALPPPSGAAHKKAAAGAAPVETTQTFYVQTDATGALTAYDQTANTISGPITVCTATADAYEGDNSYNVAAPITVGAPAQIHNFDTAGDQDWVSFAATAGTLYVLTTSNLGPNADTVLALYGTDGATLLATNDDFNGSLASQVVWRAPANGTYYAQVTNYVPQVSGCGTTYSLTLQTSAAPITTTGVFRPSNGALYLKNSNTSGYADLVLTYGQPGDQPVTGDWTGKGYKSIGIYRSGTFYLRNSNTTGYADIVIPFGASTDIPVAGDWTGKGYDSIGVYRPSTNTFLLRNSNTAGPPDIVARLGVSGDVPIVGDWTGQGKDTIGVFRPSNGIVYLRNSNSTGVADFNFVYGVAGDKPIAGDWTGQGKDTIGVDRNGVFYLRNSNSTGPADIVFALGLAGDQPIAGPWQAAGSAPARAAPSQAPKASPGTAPSSGGGMPGSGDTPINRKTRKQ